MKLRNFKQIGTAAILTAVLALNSCQKEEVLAPNKTNTTTIKNAPVSMAEVDGVYNMVFKIVNDVNSGNLSFKTDDMLSCATVSVDSSNPALRTAVIDYGSGCTSEDGTFRSGSINLTFNFSSGRELRDIHGKFVSVQFNSFKDGSIILDGTCVLTNDGPNASVNNEFAMDFNLSIDNQADAIQYTANASIVYEFVRGYQTPGTEDDEVNATGSVSGVANSESYTITIESPLVLYRNQQCQDYYVMGVEKHSIGTNPDEYIDYGNGTCDNLATKTVNGTSEEITL